MKAVKTEFEGLWIIEPVVFGDSRGYFFESYSKKAFEAAGIHKTFVQDNQSRSRKNVVRGLHFQIPPVDQAKLVRTLQGRILDVVVDLRKSQSTFGKTFTIELSSENQRQLLIPKGFAHGFSVLSDQAEILYKCDAYYSPAHERGIYFADASLNIDWGLEAGIPIVSEKDKALPKLAEIPVYF